MSNCPEYKNGTEYVLNFFNTNVNCFLQDGFKTSFFSGLALLIIGFFIDKLFPRLLKSVRDKFIITLNGLRKGKKLKLIICIDCETDVEKNIIKNDFIENIRNLIKDQKLGNLINLQIENDNQELYKALSDFDNSDKESQKKFDRTNVKIKGTFFIFGNIKSRFEKKSEIYFLKLRSLAVHGKIKIEQHSLILTAFSEIGVWDYHIDKDSETIGFRDSSELNYIFALYILAITVYIKRDYITSEQLFKELLKQVEDCSVKLSNLNVIKLKAKMFLSAIYCDRALKYLPKFSEGKNSESDIIENLINNSLRYNQNNYSTYLARAQIEFFKDNTLKRAKNTIKIAKNISGNDGLWIYSEAFLFLWEKNYLKAINSYKKVIKKTIETDETVLNGVYLFIKKVYKKHPERHEMLFALGFLLFKKSSRYFEALKYLNKFKTKVGKNNQYNILTDKTNELIKEINTQCDNLSNVEKFKLKMNWLVEKPKKLFKMILKNKVLNR